MDQYPHERDLMELLCPFCMWSTVRRPQSAPWHPDPGFSVTRSKLFTVHLVSNIYIYVYIQLPEQTKTWYHKQYKQEITTACSELILPLLYRKTWNHGMLETTKIVQSKIAKLQMKKLRTGQCLINFSSTNITEYSFTNNNGVTDKFDSELTLQELQLVDELMLQFTSPGFKVISVTTHLGIVLKFSQKKKKNSPESC